MTRTNNNDQPMTEQNGHSNTATGLVMNLPLLNAAEVIVGNLSEAERQEFFEAIAAAAEGKDLSVVHWQFLGAELRTLPKLMPKDIQSLIDQMIEGLDLFTEGKWWDNIFTTFCKIDDMFHKEWVSIAPHVQSAIYVLKSLVEVIRAVDYTDTIYTAADVVANITDAAYHAAYDASFDVETQKAAQADEDFAKLAVQAATHKATIAYAEARQRQRDTLRSLIEGAPNRET